MSGCILWMIFSFLSILNCGKTFITRTANFFLCRWTSCVMFMFSPWNMSQWLWGVSFKSWIDMKLAYTLNSYLQVLSLRKYILYVVLYVIVSIRISGQEYIFATIAFECEQIGYSLSNKWHSFILYRKVYEAGH